MFSLKSLSLWACSLLFGITALAQKVNDLGYVYKRASVDGTGKFYQGHEIAQVLKALPG